MLLSREVLALLRENFGSNNVHMISDRKGKKFFQVSLKHDSHDLFDDWDKPAETSLHMPHFPTETCHKMAQEVADLLGLDGGISYGMDNRLFLSDGSGPHMLDLTSIEIPIEQATPEFIRKLEAFSSASLSPESRECFYPLCKFSNEVYPSESTIVGVLNTLNPGTQWSYGYDSDTDVLSFHTFQRIRDPLTFTKDLHATLHDEDEPEPFLPPPGKGYAYLEGEYCRKHLEAIGDLPLRAPAAIEALSVHSRRGKGE